MQIHSGQRWGLLKRVTHHGPSPIPDLPSILQLHHFLHRSPCDVRIVQGTRQQSDLTLPATSLQGTEVRETLLAALTPQLDVNTLGCELHLDKAGL
jgi:hypothetical protein